MTYLKSIQSSKYARFDDVKWPKCCFCFLSCLRLSKNSEVLFHKTSSVVSDLLLITALFFDQFLQALEGLGITTSRYTRLFSHRTTVPGRLVHHTFVGSTGKLLSWLCGYCGLYKVVCVICKKPQILICLRGMNIIAVKFYRNFYFWLYHFEFKEKIISHSYSIL